MKRAQRRSTFEMIAGILVGLLTPIFGFAVLFEFYPQLPKMHEIPWETWKFLINRVLMFAVIINAGVFFIGLRIKRDALAKGILIACILCIIAVLYIKFIA